MEKKPGTAVNEKDFIDLYNNDYSLAIIQKKLSISRYTAESIVKKNKLKPRTSIIVKKRNPDQRWTQEKMEEFMSLYVKEGSQGVADKFNVSREYANVLAMRFRKKGY